MTLPANDAFTLGLAHDETRRPHQSRSRSLPRSPSPKISFSSSKSTVTATHTSRVERGLARRASKHTSSNRHKDGSGALADGLHNSFTKAVQPPLQEIEEKREDSPTPSPPNPIQKVDWEIPRKLLHSSIGITPVISPSLSRLTRSPFRISHFVPVLFKRIPQTCRSQPWNRAGRYNCTSRSHPSSLSTI
jgi:hypothetical protein